MEAAPGEDLTGPAGLVLDVVDALGEVGVALLVLLESVVPPIPSEVVLPLAGYLAARGALDLVTVVLAASAGSVLGAWLLYGLGARAGPSGVAALVRRVPLLDADDVDRATAWFARHGGPAVLLGRCVPVVRSLVSLPAGVERMPFLRFTVYTAIGSTVWNGALVGAGYALGARFRQVEQYSGPVNAVALGAIAVAVAVFVVRRLRTRRSRVTG